MIYEHEYLSIIHVMHCCLFYDGTTALTSTCYHIMLTMLLIAG